jgi:hypothetical protein
MIGADVGTVVGGGVEVLGGAAVALDFGEGGVAGIDGGAADHEEVFEEVLERGGVLSFDLQAQVGRLTVGAADAELFDLEAAVVLDDLIEDVLDDM